MSSGRERKRKKKKKKNSAVDEEERERWRSQRTLIASGPTITRDPSRMFITTGTSTAPLSYAFAKKRPLRLLDSGPFKKDNQIKDQRVFMIRGQQFTSFTEMIKRNVYFIQLQVQINLLG